MKAPSSALPLLLPVLLFLSCATVLKGSSETIKITSDPAAAPVYINDVFRGNTPISIPLSVREDAQIRVEAPGYDPETRSIQSSISLGYAFIDVMLMVVPLAVDIYTGSIYSFDDSTLHFQYAPVAPPPPKPKRQPNTTPKPASRWTFGNDSPQQSKQQSKQHCCVNENSFECPSMDALARCMPPELPACLMNCGMQFSCSDECFAKYPSDPSGCQRIPNEEATCR